VGWRKLSVKGAERVSGSRHVGGWQESVVGLGERVPRGARRGFDRADQSLIWDSGCPTPTTTGVHNCVWGNRG
jgi:hypothetical protein